MSMGHTLWNAVLKAVVTEIPVGLFYRVKASRQDDEDDGGKCYAHRHGTPPVLTRPYGERWKGVKTLRTGVPRLLDSTQQSSGRRKVREAPR